MAFIAMNPQGCLYAKAVKELYGVLPEKIKWDFIKSDVSKQPIWLEKSQRFSEASNQNITPMSWRRACKERGITDEGIIAIGDKYEPNISNFFFRVVLDVEPNMVEKVWKDFEETGLHIAKHGHIDQRQVITRDCNWCDYYNICYGQFTGADVEYIKNKDYIIEENQEGTKDVESVDN
jgi:hypothetical protein